jgi:DNA-binding transcriptional MerR regulator
MKSGIYIGKVARAAALTPQAIRFYERLGLIEKAQRTNAGYRVYPPTTFGRVRFIKQAQKLGLNLTEIREVLRLKYSGQSPCNCVTELLQNRLAQLKRQIAEMERVRREIKRCLRAGQEFARLPHEASAICPLIQTRDVRTKRRSRKKGGEKR